MPRAPVPLHPLPPLKRGCECSRLHIQLWVTAYARAVPVPSRSFPQNHSPRRRGAGSYSPIPTACGG